ncbi:MAG: metallophosphoesterase family protein, partial [Proteobacteria bacterium]|nr:metallophosphoesterase family protein [Pseudomonadota bacterium]
MRIYAVADIHSRARRLDMIRERVRRLEPDVVVVAGDITRYVRPLPVLAVLNDLPVPVLAVRGNSDLPRTERLIEHLPNLRALHLRETEVRGVSFVGLSGAVPVPFHTRTAWREKTLGRRVGPMIREETVLVTHAPPYGTLDDVFERLGDLHAGSRQVRDLVL